MKTTEIISDEPSFKDGLYSAEDDAFNHGAIAEALLKLIKDNKPPLSIGLFGGWGVGKTSIVNILRTKSLSENVGVIYFNAWKYSGDSFRRQFLLTVAQSEILFPKDKERTAQVEELEKLNHSDLVKDQKKSIKLSLEGLAKLDIFLLIVLALFLAGSITGRLFGWWTSVFSDVAVVVTLITLAIRNFQSLISVNVDNVTDPQLIFPEQFATKFKTLIDNAVAKGTFSRFLIIVDDLDRCDPETIKNVLVSLKTFLENDHCYFLVPMDDSSVVQLFEVKNMNFGYEQLRKYFPVSVRVPGPPEPDILDFATSKSTQFDIPPEVAFIGAIGNCRDARKMKHFLNSFKVKLQVAIERKQQGYLVDIEPEKIYSQLAKIVVLEYQYPEFFHFISRFPDALFFFTNALTSKQQPNDDRLEDWLFELSVSDLQSLWDKFPGLKRFLENTSDIKMDDLDVIIRLKAPNQVVRLTDLGKLIRRAVTEKVPDDLWADKLQDDFVSENSREIADSLRIYLSDPIAIVQKRAGSMAFTFLKSGKLPPAIHTELANAVTQTMCNENVDASMLLEELLLLMDSFPNLHQPNRLLLARRIANTLFVQQEKPVDFSTLLNHPSWPQLCREYPPFAAALTERVDKWFAQATSPEDNVFLVDQLLKTTVTKSEMRALGIDLPSVATVAKCISLLSDSEDESAQQTNSKITELLLSDLSIDKLPDLASALSEKIETIIRSDSPGKTSLTQNLANAFRLARHAPSWIPSAKALAISQNLQGGLLQTLTVPEDRTECLVIVSICYSSTPDANNQKTIWSILTTRATALSAIDAQNLSTKIREVHHSMETTPRAFLEWLIQSRWSKVTANFTSNAEELIEDAALVRRNPGIIDQQEFVNFHLNVLNADSGATISFWSSFISDSVEASPNELLKPVMDKSLSNLFTSTLETVARVESGELLLSLLSDYPENRDINIFTRLFQSLASDDSTLMDFTQAQMDTIFSIFGTPHVEGIVSSVFDSLLSKPDLGIFEASIDICIRFAKSISSNLWPKAAGLINTDLFNPQKSLTHKKVLLDIGWNITNTGDIADHLSAVLFEYKDSGDDELKGKAWEVYRALTTKRIIPEYTPPPQHEDNDKQS